MDKLVTYLYSRMESTAAWIGFIGLVLEFMLHLGHVSTLMVVLFLLLIVLPETAIKNWFADLSKKVKE